MSLCFIINSFNNKTIDAMGAAILPNLLRLSMLRKPDVTSVVSQTVLVTGAVPANQPVSGGEATDRRKSFRRKMADCPS